MWIDRVYRRALSEMALAAGGQVVLHDEFDSRRTLSAISDHRVTFTLLLPHMLYRLVDEYAANQDDLTSLRSIFHCGAASSPDRINQAMTIFGPVITQTYTLREAPARFY